MLDFRLNRQRQQHGGALVSVLGIGGGVAQEKSPPFILLTSSWAEAIGLFPVYFFAVGIERKAIPDEENGKQMNDQTKDD